MNFLHLSLLAGTAAMAVPVALHLLGRRQPKSLTFPALRFVKHTVMQQRSSWQLRHVLLLLLRVGIFAAMALALARPRVHSAMLGSAIGIGVAGTAALFATLVAVVALVGKHGSRVWVSSSLVAAALWIATGVWASMSLSRGPIVPSSDQSAPVAAVLIVDTGPSMGYRTDNEPRVQAAKKMAAWILSKLPVDSRVGVLTGAPLSALALDPASARGQIDVLQPGSIRVDMVSRLETAMDLVLGSELERKEIYVITDLMTHGWETEANSLRDKLKEHSNEVLVQVIDVGKDLPINYRIGDLPTEQQSVPEGSDLNWEVSVSRTPDAPAASVTIELLEEETKPGLPILRNGKMEVPKAEIVDRKVVDLTREEAASVTLTKTKIASGSHNFFFQIDTKDPLESDNKRYATVVSHAQQPALIVSDDADISRFVRLVLNPVNDQADSPAEDTSLTRSVRYTQLSDVPLERFKVVCLIDPPALAPSTVANLERHVQQGGGLLVCLGPDLGNEAAAAESATSRLLPGKPSRIVRHSRNDRSSFLTASDLSHPLFHVFGLIGKDVPWNLFPIFRMWEFDSLAKDVQVLMSTSDTGSPAVMLQPRGNGQILTIATPIPHGETPGEVPWNELTIGADPWPAFGLMLGAVRVLSGQTHVRYNYIAGDTVSLPNDVRLFPSLYELFNPAGGSRRVQAADEQLLLGQLELAGVYRLRGVNAGAGTRGVSVNTLASDTQLKRLTQEELESILGRDRFRLAKKQEDVESSVGHARYGRELFPMLMVVVAGLFLAEQAMSNRFYQIRLGSQRRKS